MLMAPDSSKSTLKGWLKAGRVAVDGQEENKPHRVLAPGQEIVLGSKEKRGFDELPPLFQDDSLIVIDKPEGLLSVATDKGVGISAHDILKERFRPERVYVVHRLDRGTSGVMLFALSLPCLNGLKALLEERNVSRTYMAIVEGILEGEGAWESYLWEDKVFQVHSSQNPKNGRLAITHYEALDHRNGMTLVKFRLETGRKHQIRVQTKEAGHPVLGDRRYGPVKDPIGRLCLHAFLLEFVHPVTGKTFTFHSPVPRDFKKLFPRGLDA